MSGFKDRVALVTGAGSGIGEAISLDLAARGANVVVADLDLPSANSVAAAIGRAGGNAVAVLADVSDPASVERMVGTAVSTFGALHLAVNNAGIGGPAVEIADYPLDGWHKVVEVNLHGVFYCMKFEIAAMLSSGGGAIVNMSSILGSVGWANASAYVACKHALVGLTKTAALEYASRNIRVNAVGPAFIDTPLLSNNLDETVLAQLAGMHPANRLGTPGEVSALACFLLSEDASFINGSYHLVDGGYTAR